jgi:hypothetical protein
MNQINCSEMRLKHQSFAEIENYGSAMMIKDQDSKDTQIKLMTSSALEVWHK